MNVNDMFPKKYASGLDLQGRAVNVTIAGISKEQMHPPGAGTVEKYVLYFKETGRGVVLTKTLAEQIAAAVGHDETDQWTGKRITIYPEEIKVAGAVRLVIRARAAANAPAMAESGAE
jgi:hypothetical protein